MREILEMKRASEECNPLHRETAYYTQKGLLMILEESIQVTLLGAWLFNQNREDIPLFDPHLFSHRKLFEAVKEGKTFEQISTEHLNDRISIVEFAKGFDHMEYRQARSEAINIQKIEYTEQMKTADSSKTKELTNKIIELQVIIDGVDLETKSTDFATLFINELNDRQQEQQPKYGKGFQYLDMYTGGIHRGQLTTLGARPGIGKSAFALQVAMNVAKQGYKVLYLPLEMTTVETLERILLQQQTVTRAELDKPTPGVIDKIRNELQILEADNNLAIYEGLNKIDGIKKKIREEQPYLVVIDQLTQVSTTDHYRDNRERYIAITRELKRVAMEYKVAILLLSQLNRNAKNTTEPSIEHLHESDSTGQDSDNVFVLYTENDEEGLHRIWRQTTLRIAKQRSGISGKNIPLMFDGERVTFIACDTSKSDQQTAGNIPTL